MKLLFITATRLGDAVLSTGLLDHLVSRGGVSATVVCGPVPAEIFECVPGLERLIAMEKRPANLHWWELWRQTIGTFWDLVVDLRASPVPFVLLRKRRRTKFRAGSGHRVESLGRWFGCGHAPSPRVWTAERHRREASAILPGRGEVLALAPTAQGRAKIWPAENYIALARRLTGPGGALAGARIVIVGGPREEDRTGPIVEALPDEATVDLTGRAHLLTVAEVFRRCSIVVANDSGLMHMAAASGVPTVGLFGPSPAENYAPWGARTAVVRSPSGSMKELAVESVDRSVRRLLEGVRGSKNGA